MLTLQDFLQVDLPAMLACALATASCALVGNFLVLRRQALMGDALAHSVLPGIVAGFLIAGSRATLPMFAGALAAAVLAAVLIELVRRLGRMDAGTAMGVVFSLMFAAGVVLIEQAAAHSTDLDAECVLFGQLEDILWLAPTGLDSLLEPATWRDLPREVTTLLVVFPSIALLIWAFAKELVITSFDRELAASLGIRPGLVDLGLMVLTGVVTVASFEAVGSILVIAMLIGPAATARLLTDRLRTQIALSLLLALACALGGYVLAAWVPLWLGSDHSLAVAGMVASLSGVGLGLAVLLAPRYGILARRRRGHLLAARPA